jgi:hypothetical protein
MYKKEVADIEVYPNFFLYVGHDAEGEGKYEYSLHSSDTENTIGEFIDRMRDNIAMIGFNNSGYDYPVIHYIMTNETVLHWSTVEEVCEAIYLYSKNELIESEDKVWISYKDILVPQLDLYKLMGFTNAARRTSLKAVEVAMRMENIEDLPYPPDMRITKEQSLEVIAYCHHDVKATKLFYYEIEGERNLRKGLSETYGLDLYDAPDMKIGSDIILKAVSEKLNRPKWEINKLRTFRKGITILNVILPCIKFKTVEFNKVLDKFQRTIVKDTKGDLEHSTVFRGIKYDYGTGGLHACIDSGTYKSNDHWMILDIDVVSYYPNIAIRNKQYPEHLGIEFCEVYENMFETRKTFAKNTPENYGMKIALNSAYGKSNDVYSFLYDPKFTMFITVNGQLLLSMLTENILLGTKAELLQANTDGISIKVPRTEYDTVKQLMKQWEELTSLQLEEVEYKAMFISNVNNYIAVTVDGKAKYKGSYEIDKQYHKDHSNRIVSIAIARKCLFDISPEETIKNHMYMTEYEDIGVKAYGIYDFCASVRARGDAKYQTRMWSKGQYVIIDLPKTNRYFVSNNGVELLKVLPPNMNAKDNIAEHREKYPNQLDLFMFDDDVIERKERVSQVEAGQKITMFNRYYKDDYDLNIRYYINECNKILNKL